MKKRLVTIMAMVLMVGEANAEWRPNEAPKQVPTKKVPFA